MKPCEAFSWPKWNELGGCQARHSRKASIKKKSPGSKGVRFGCTSSSSYSYTVKSPDKQKSLAKWLHQQHQPPQPSTMFFTESQYHRMLGVGRDLCGSSSPTLLPKQGHPEQAAQDRFQVGLEYLQRRLHNLPRQPGPGLRHPQREEVLPHVHLELALLQFVPFAPCPGAGHHWKEFGPILSSPTLKILASNP